MRLGLDFTHAAAAVSDSAAAGSVQGGAAADVQDDS